MRFIDTFEKHRNDPHTSLAQYIKELRLKLGREIKSRTKIYLDTNYWVELRNASLGRARNNNFTNLLVLLKDEVKAGNVICPISDEVFYEILLQSDLNTLRASAKLIDELSGGVALLSEDERIKYEVLYFVYTTIEGKGSVHQPDEFVWTKVAFVYGMQFPNIPNISSEENLVIQKAFFDQMWSISLSEMIDIIKSNENDNVLKRTDITDKLNRDKVKYAHENKSFKQLFLTEISGVIDVYQPLLEEAMIYLFEKEYGFRPKTEENTKNDRTPSIANAIYNLFKANKLGSYFPSLIISAGLHASVRQDIQRKFKANDMSDFKHAAAALPYYDYFFTEKSLRDLITRNNIRFDKKYNCVVESNPGNARALIMKHIS